jgi:hypothetical protein
MPTNIKPTCAIEEKARNLLKLFCLIANKLPVIIVRSDRMNNILYHASANGLKTVYKTETNTKSTAPFEITDKKEVTAMGAPS